MIKHDIATLCVIAFKQHNTTLLCTGIRGKNVIKGFLDIKEISRHMSFAMFFVRNRPM